MTKSATKVSVIGPGALGGALIDLIFHNSENFSLHSIWGRRIVDNFFISGGEKIPSQTLFPKTESDLGDLIFIAVPDDQIAKIANKLSELNFNWKRFSIVHLSGSHSSDLLSPLSENGASVASLHPLQTFTVGDNAKRFKNIWFTLEGATSIFPQLELLVQEAGAFSLRMNPDQKQTMHLAAVFASNYLISLLSAVEQITEANNIHHGVEMMKPLIRQTFYNFLEKGAENALSGPIVRGDQSTVLTHLDLLKQTPDLQNLYKQLGLQALQIAKRSSRISKKDSEIIDQILSVDES